MIPGIVFFICFIHVLSCFIHEYNNVEIYVWHLDLYHLDRTLSGVPVSNAAVDNAADSVGGISAYMSQSAACLNMSVLTFVPPIISTR